MRVIMEIPIDFIIGTISIVFFLLVLIIGFMFKILTDNTKAIDGINITLAKIEIKDGFNSTDLVRRHNYIEDRFKIHDEKLSEHDRRILKIEK